MSDQSDDRFRPREIRGGHDAAGLRFGLVVRRFNGLITERLLDGALTALQQGGDLADATEVSRGIQLAQMDSGIPIIFCVLTCDTLEQAIDRAGLKSGNKGYEAGLAALEMAHLSKQLRPMEAS